MDNITIALLKHYLKQGMTAGQAVQALGLPVDNYHIKIAETLQKQLKGSIKK